MKKKCTVPGCSKEWNEKFAWGMCNAHYQRFKNYGDPNYLTPESVRREHSRTSQLKNKKAKPTTYKKFLGKHEHRFVMEKFIGRTLKPGEIVHHKDGNRHNNEIYNLELMTQSEHARLHHPYAQSRRKVKTHCPSGHPYSGDNLYIDKNNAKVCRKCRANAQVKFRRGKNESDS